MSCLSNYSKQMNEYELQQNYGEFSLSLPTGINILH